MKRYKVTLIVETEDGNPGKWDWSDLLDNEAIVIKCLEMGDE